MSALEQHLEDLDIRGFTILPDVLSPEQVATTVRKMDALYEADIERYGMQQLLQIRELGTLRFMMASDRYFLELIAVPRVLEIMEALLGPACILHLQNGIIL